MERMNLRTHERTHSVHLFVHKHPQKQPALTHTSPPTTPPAVSHMALQLFFLGFVQQTRAKQNPSQPKFYIHMFTLCQRTGAEQISSHTAAREALFGTLYKVFESASTARLEPHIQHQLRLIPSAAPSPYRGQPQGHMAPSPQERPKPCTQAGFGWVAGRRVWQPAQGWEQCVAGCKKLAWGPITPTLLVFPSGNKNNPAATLPVHGFPTV